MIRLIACSVVILAFLAGASNLPAQTASPPPATHDPSGHGFHHSFEHAGQWTREFDDPARDAWQKPDQVVDALQLEPTARVADIGAGTGYFSARIARKIPDGKLFAVDLQPDMLRHLAERKQREGLHVLEPVSASAASPNLPEPVDLVLMVDTYHHIDNRIAYFAALRASLRPGGRVAIVDFSADSPEGPPPAFRLPPETVIRELAAAGYTLAARHTFLPRQYFLVFQVKAP